MYICTRYVYASRLVMLSTMLKLDVPIIPDPIGNREALASPSVFNCNYLSNLSIFSKFLAKQLGTTYFRYNIFQDMNAKSTRESLTTSKSETKSISSNLAKQIIFDNYLSSVCIFVVSFSFRGVDGRKTGNEENR